MKNIIYLALFAFITVLGFQYFHQYSKQSNFAPSILNNKIDEKTESSKIVGEYLSAAVAQRSGNFEKAIEYYQKALIDNPRNLDISSRLYGLYLYEGLYSQVVELSKRNIKIDEINSTEPKDYNPNPYMVVALDSFKKGDYRKVKELLKPLVHPDIQDKSHIDGVVIPLILAWTFVIEEEYKQAFNVIDNITTNYMLSIFSYNRALINDVANDKIHFEENRNDAVKTKALTRIADVFAEIGRFSMQNETLDEAVIYFRLAKFLKPNNHEYTKMLASSFEAKQEFNNAINIYESVDSESKEYQNTLIPKALAYHKLRRNEQAINILKNLTEDKTLGYKSLMAIGSILLSENKNKEAIKYFKKAESQIYNYSKEHWSLYFNLGVANDRLKNWKEAESYLKKSVQIFPENPESLNYLAYSWIIKNKNVKQSRAMLESAVIRSGGAPHILDSYGWALYKLGHYNDALPFLEQAALSLPYNSIINDHLGDLYWSLGRFREAKFQWKKAAYYFDENKESPNEINLEGIEEKLKNGKK